MEKHTGGSPRATLKIVRKTRQNKDGFTIIEVLIVLAIAGLILLIVFLAVPTLKKNARNHTRKVAVDYVAAEMESYYATSGKYPLFGSGAAQDNRSSFVSGLNAGGPTSLFDIRYTDNSGSHDYPFSGAGAPADVNDAMDEISIEHGHVCNRAPGLVPGSTDYPLKVSINGDSNYRAYAIWTQLEKLPVYCRDNGVE